MDVTVTLKLSVRELDILREAAGNELERRNENYKEGLVPLPERKRHSEKTFTLSYLYDVLMGKK